MALYISSACEEKSRSHDTSDYDEHAENFDANTDQMDTVEGILHRLVLR